MAEKVPKLSVLRERLMGIDYRWLKLLAERDEVVRLVAERKEMDGIPVVRLGVEKKRFADIRAWAKQLGLPKEVACSAFQLVLGHACRVEIMHLQRRKGARS